MQQSGGNLRCDHAQRRLRHPNLQSKHCCRHPVDRTFGNIPGLVPRSFVDTTERRRTADTHARRRATSRNSGAQARAGCGATGGPCRRAGRDATRNSSRHCCPRHHATRNCCACCASRTRAPHYRRCHCPVTSSDAAR